MNPDRLRPLRGMCLVELLPPPRQTDSAALFLPDPKQPRLEQGRVLRIGDWPRTKNGLAVLPDFAIGSRVVVASESGTKLREGTRLLKIVPQSRIRAVISES